MFGGIIGQLSVSQAWRIVNALAGEANVTKKVSTHTWRHSIATQLFDAGAPLHKVSSFLGLSDPKITVKAHYSDSEGHRSIAHGAKSGQDELLEKSALLLHVPRLGRPAHAST
jgi:integrase